MKFTDNGKFHLAGWAHPNPEMFWMICLGFKYFSAYKQGKAQQGIDGTTFIFPYLPPSEVPCSFPAYMCDSY